LALAGLPAAGSAQGTSADGAGGGSGAHGHAAVAGREGDFTPQLCAMLRTGRGPGNLLLQGSGDGLDLTVQTMHPPGGRVVQSVRVRWSGQGERGAWTAERHHRDGKWTDSHGEEAAGPILTIDGTHVTVDGPFRSVADPEAPTQHGHIEVTCPELAKSPGGGS
ncbi:MAG TPA: hypothetical protein VKA44_00770, partial [Gemmatimonadota bacterium]|nr:hypothetical protein [Gemmatimonadota bacterium]